MRQRSVGKPRSSLGAMSDTSSLMSSMSVGNPQTPQLGINGTNTPTGANASMVSLGMGGLADGLLTWDANELEGDGDFGGSFTMPDGVSRADWRCIELSDSKSSRCSADKNGWPALTAR